MKKLIFVLLMLMLGSAAFGANITNLPWTAANIETLRSFDKAAIFEFITNGAPDPSFTEDYILAFRWYDLAADGKYELLIDGSSGPDAGGVTVYWQEAPGKYTSQYVEGGGATERAVRDLNGDGKYELIVSKLAVENRGTARFFWPAVYQLAEGKYVEASHEFPRFYDDEVLPAIESQLAAIRERVQKQHGGAASDSQKENLAGLSMERSAILRMLGRDPTAGLQDAYEWMKSDDPNLLQDAAATFKQVGGHEQESRAASRTYERVLCQQNPRLSLCRGTAHP